MQFGIMMRGQFPAEDAVADRFQEMLEQARMAERLGYHSITKGAHYSTHPLQDLQQVRFFADRRRGAGLRSTQRIVAAIAQAARRGRTTRTLDIITSGKATSSGVGYRDIEFAAFGTSKSQRGKRFEENLTAIKRLWTEEKVTTQDSLRIG